MSNPFVPTGPETMILVEISAREAHMIKVMRRYYFGKITVEKANGIIVRVLPSESILIDEEKGMELAAKENSL